MEEIKKNEEVNVEVKPVEAISEISLEGLTPALRAACENAGWKELVPVQAKAIPYMLAGRDVRCSREPAAGKPALIFYPLCRKLI